MTNPTVPARDAREVAREAHEWAMRWHFGGGIEAGLDVYCDREYQTNPVVSGVIDSYAAFALQVHARALRDARRDALLWAADKIEVEPAVNAIPFAEMLRALASKEGAE